MLTFTADNPATFLDLAPFFKKQVVIDVRGDLSADSRTKFIGTIESIHESNVFPYLVLTFTGGEKLSWKRGSTVTVVSPEQALDTAVAVPADQPDNDKRTVTLYTRSTGTGIYVSEDPDTHGRFYQSHIRAALSDYLDRELTDADIEDGGEIARPGMHAISTGYLNLWHIAV